jgi:class 3 adenylate cyclase/tetratricopeptide (TPR) repeat protein
MTYEPRPVDTSGIELAAQILELTEQLARNTHEVWARKRIDEGWTWGPIRDDKARQHPGLVPYDELADSEKQYDRNTALETLKVIQSSGFQILPRGVDLRSIDEGDSSRATALLLQIEQVQQRAARSSEDKSRVPELIGLLRIWNSHNPERPEWNSDPAPYRHLARRFIKLGEAPLAREVAHAALTLSPGDADGGVSPWENDVKLRQLYALALARGGNPDAGQEILLRLYDEKNLDEETLGLLGRTYKDQAFAPNTSKPAKSAFLNTSLKFYVEACNDSGSFWTGCNVATLHRLLGNETESEITAQKILDECRASLTSLQESAAPPADTYWELATLGEASLNLGDFEQAGNFYRQAYEAAPRNFGDLNTTRRHARWLIDWWIDNGRVQDIDRDLLDNWLPIPKVAVFSGHMIDRPDRTTPRFPAARAATVKRTIQKWVTDNDAFVGYSSAACGADLLFQQVIQEFGGESRIILPYDYDKFRKDSVAFAGDDWLAIFDEVLENATQVTIPSPQRSQGDGVSYDYANQVVHGLASIRAAELQSNSGNPIGLVVWNNHPGDGPGGTASVVQRWQNQKMMVDQIDLSVDEPGQDGCLPIVTNPTTIETRLQQPARDSGGNKVRAMLFGDAVNFSKLDEDQVSSFIEHFMRPIAQIVRRYEYSNVARNTWGDGLYLVFDDIREAGLCALDICQFVQEQIPASWETNQLPGDLNIRIALHAGPVLGAEDPITQQFNCTGTHVSRAARLEPKTPPGEVYASQAFAALCAEHKITDFTYEYVKQLDWAKSYGSFPTFVLRGIS